MPNSVDTFVAKAAGKAAGLRARVKGLTGVFNVLVQQHQQAATLLGRVQRADEPEKRRELWLQARCELICHERAELSTVYPVIAENALNADISQRHAEEAQQLETAISDIDTLGVTSSHWAESIARLIALVQQHVEEEEHDFFPRAQDTMGKEAAHSLERPFLAAQERCREQLG
jgi:hemerythrin superfamily protein